jgi:hypothetical protein
VAVVAVAIAFYSIYVTRSVARKRASVDFFLKTDMDAGMVATYATFMKSLAAWTSHDAAGTPIEKFVRGQDGRLTADYSNILGYLNIHELVAVGINNRVFDEDVCFHFWSIALIRHVDRSRKLMEYQILIDGFESSYLETLKLYSRWKKRRAEWQKKQLKAKQKGLPPVPAGPAPAVAQNPALPSQGTTAENPLPPKAPDVPPPAGPA